MIRLGTEFKYYEEEVREVKKVLGVTMDTAAQVVMKKYEIDAQNDFTNMLRYSFGYEDNRPCCMEQMVIELKEGLNSISCALSDLKT